MTVDTNTRSPFRDTVYVCWTHFTATSLDIMFKRITDFSPLGLGGLDGSGPATKLSASDSNQGCSINTKQNGNVGVAWTDFANDAIMFRKTIRPAFTSVSTFGPLSRATPTDGIGAYSTFLPACGSTPRASTYPVLVTTRAPSSGNWVIVWSSFFNGDGDAEIMATRSFSGNTGTWTVPFQMSDEVASSLTSMFMPGAAVSDNGGGTPEEGTVFVIWFDERNGPDAVCTTFGDHSDSIRPIISFDGDQQISIEDSTVTADFAGIFVGDYDATASLTQLARSFTIVGIQVLELNRISSCLRLYTVVGLMHHLLQNQLVTTNR